MHVYPDTNIPMQWCLGFIFDQQLLRVVMQLKEGTLHVGKWNGIGGKVGLDESPREAMVRECKEEAGIDIPAAHWIKVGYIRGPDRNPWQVTAYAAKIDDANPGHWEKCTVLLMAIERGQLEEWPLAPHVLDLVVYAVGVLLDNFGEPLIIHENGDVQGQGTRGVGGTESTMKETDGLQGDGDLHDRDSAGGAGPGSEGGPRPGAEAPAVEPGVRAEPVLDGRPVHGEGEGPPRLMNAWRAQRELLARVHDINVGLVEAHKAAGEQLYQQGVMLANLTAERDTLALSLSLSEQARPNDAEQQMVAMAMADLALMRPGWDDALGTLATKMGIYDYFVRVRELHRDLIKPLGSIMEPGR